MDGRLCIGHSLCSGICIVCIMFITVFYVSALVVCLYMCMVLLICIYIVFAIVYCQVHDYELCILVWFSCYVYMYVSLQLVCVFVSVYVTFQSGVSVLFHSVSFLLSVFVSAYVCMFIIKSQGRSPLCFVFSYV